MHCRQRLLFRRFALVALLPVVSCTLTDHGFEPVRVTSPASPGADLAEPSPASIEPGATAEASGPTDGAGAVEVTRPSEAPASAAIPLAPDEPSVSGGVQSGGEMNVDAGVASCVGCGDRACSLDGGASNGSCQAPSCSDGVQNQDEAGIDCGGSACVPCPCSYGTPEVLGDPNFAGNSLYSPSLSPDGLTLYFGLYIQGATETIGFSTRAAAGDPFGLGNVLPAPLNASVEGTPRLAADGLTLYFYSERPGGLGGRDIYRAQRPTPSAAFDSITNLTEVNSGGMDQLPWVTPDQLSMYFASDRAGRGLDIYRSVRASVTAPWGTPAPLTELNTLGLENGVTLSSDEREILFASDRRGTSDFFRAVRAPGESVFRAPEYVASISSAAEDSDPALSPDGTELYFASTRDGTDSRIWRVSRTCP